MGAQPASRFHAREPAIGEAVVKGAGLEVVEARSSIVNDLTLPDAEPEYRLRVYAPLTRAVWRGLGVLGLV